MWDSKGSSVLFDIPKPPLSGEDIWINLPTQKRYAVHINACDTVESRNSKLNFVTKIFHYCEVFTIQHVIYGIK